MCARLEKLSLSHRNCLDRRPESWRPKVFYNRETLRGGLLELARRFLDLQYASIYRDIEALARRMSGSVLDVGCERSRSGTFSPASVSTAELTLRGP